MVLWSRLCSLNVQVQGSDLRVQGLFRVQGLLRGLSREVSGQVLSVFGCGEIFEIIGAALVLRSRVRGSGVRAY